MRPDFVVVANPTNAHVPTALAAIQAGCHVLVEKPVSHRLDACANLVRKVDEGDLTCSVACNLRFHPALKLLREWVADDAVLGQALIARAHFGTYLPAWHPWEDFRNSYAANPEMGGGTALTNIHEIDYLLWIFGPAAHFSGMTLGINPLGTTVDEGSALMIRHNSGVLSVVTTTFAQRPPSRTLEVVFTRGTVQCDLIEGSWVMRPAQGDARSGTFPGFEIDNTYRDQATAFLRSLQGERFSGTSLEEGVAAVRIALSAKNEPQA